MGRVISRCLAWLVPALLLPGLASAYLPSLKEIYERVSTRPAGISRAIVETHTVVFNPFDAGDRTPNDNAEPLSQPLPERSFREKIYWIPQSFLGIETTAEDGTPLHFYLNEGIVPVEANLTDTRPFATLDILPPYLPFLEANAAEWKRGMTYWGLAPRKVDLVRGFKDVFYYRLTAGPERSLWLDQDALRPVRLETLVEGNVRPLHLTIEFSEFVTVVDGKDNVGNVYYPRVVNYLLNGRLFKQTRLVDFRTNPPLSAFPVTAFRNKAKSLVSTRSLDLTSGESLP